jgi:hypothetical protein
MLMMIIMAGVAVSLPIVGVVLVSIASRREDAAFSLGGPAGGPVQLAARRLLGFTTEMNNWPQSKSEAYDRAVRANRLVLASVDPANEDEYESPRIAAASGLVIRPALYRPAA